MNRDAGLLIWRIGLGGLMLGHGWGKLMQVLSGDFTFADPIGIGAAPTLLLAVFAEFFCALAVVIGFRVRWAVVPLIATMVVAAFVVHGADPWAKKELPLLFATGFLGLFFTGSGKYSLDIRRGSGKQAGIP